MRTENNRKSLQLGTPLISFSFAVAASENFRSSEMQLLEVATTPRTPRLRIEILPWNTADIIFEGMNRSRVIESQLSDNHVQSCRTSKMSHDRGWRAACRNTINIPWFHFALRSIARGVTAMVVGSGDLLALFSMRDGFLHEAHTFAHWLGENAAFACVVSFAPHAVAFPPINVRNILLNFGFQ